MKAIIAALLMFSTQAYAQLCESGYCPEDGYIPVGRAYEVKHEPREAEPPAPRVSAPDITTKTTYQRAVREPDPVVQPMTRIGDKPSGK